MLEHPRSSAPTVAQELTMMLQTENKVIVDIKIITVSELIIQLSV